MATKTSYRTSTQTDKRRTIIIALSALAALALIAVLAYAVWAALQPVPLLGQEHPIMAAEHIPDGQRATNYNTDPPTSGQHYAQPAEAGFYEEAPVDEQLVHNLEHGHIVVYYNCSELDASACEDLQQGIRQAMESAGVTENTRTLKIVAVPRTGMDNLVTYTSWGRMYRAESFDRDEMLLFVEQNRNRAPEPFAP
ncbi:MAG TPA: DUF3105 domain-containing protein [Anaerolineales bacterium]